MPEFNLFMAPQGYWWSVGVNSVMDLTLSIHNCAMMFHSACQRSDQTIVTLELRISHITMLLTILDPWNAMYPDDLYTYFANFLSRSLHNQKRG